MTQATLKNRRATVAAKAKCPVESALREWARLKRQGQPAGETPDTYWGNTPWEDAVYTALGEAEEHTATTKLGAAFQLLIGAMSGDVDNNPMEHRCLLSAYQFFRQTVEADADLEFAERYFFSGQELYKIPRETITPRRANPTTWIRIIDRDLREHRARMRSKGVIV
jgi:hypothetical protein